MFTNMFAIGILEVAFMLDAVVRFHFTPIDIGFFFMIMGVVMVVGNIVFGKASDKIGRKWFIVVGSAIGAFSLLLFMVANDNIGFYVAGAILGVGMAMRGPTIQALIADLTDKNAYGSVMGTFGAVNNSAYAKFFELDEILTSRFITILTLIALMFLPIEIAILMWWQQAIL